MSARGDENSNAQRQPASQASIVSFFAAPNAHAKRAREGDDVDAIMIDGGDASAELAGASGDRGKGKIAKIGTPSGAARDDDDDGVVAVDLTDDVVEICDDDDARVDDASRKSVAASARGAATASTSAAAEASKKPVHSFFTNFQKRKEAKGDKTVGAEMQAEFIKVKPAPIEEALGPIHVGYESITYDEADASEARRLFDAWEPPTTSTAPSTIEAGAFALMERKMVMPLEQVASQRPSVSSDTEIEAYLTDVAAMANRADAEASGETSAAHASDVEIAQTRGELRQAFNAIKSRGAENVTAQWVDRYRPLEGLDVCGRNNAAAVGCMRRWFKAWNARIELQAKGKPVPEPSRPCMPRKVFDEDDDEYWESDDDDDDGFGGGASVANGVLISGPVGCGKTAAVYALANEFGFKVIEANTLEKRTGTDILSRFMEATQSKRFSKKASSVAEGIVKVDTDDDKVEKKPKAPVGLKAFFSGVKKPEVEGKSEAKAEAPPSVAPKGKDATPKAIETHSVILFEEIDVKLGTERGFMAALSQICEATKRPVIFTSNTSVLPELSMNLPLARLRFEGLTVRDCATYGALASAAAASAIRPDDAKALALACKGDLRRTIHNAQVVTFGDSTVDLDAIDLERHSTLLIDSARAAAIDGVAHLSAAHLEGLKALYARTIECERLEHENMVKIVEEGLYRHELRLKQLEMEKEARRLENRAKKQKILGIEDKPELELKIENSKKEEDEAEVKARIIKSLSAFAPSEPAAEPDWTLVASSPPAGGWARSQRELSALAELAETLSQVDELRTGTCRGITGLCRRDAPWSKETIGDEEALEDCSPDEDFYLSNGPARQTLGGSDNVSVNASAHMSLLAGRKYTFERKALRDAHPENDALSAQACAPSTPLKASKRARGSTRAALIAHKGEMHPVWRARALAEAAGGVAGNLKATTDRLGYVARMVRIQCAPKTMSSPSSRESRRHTRNRRQHLTLASETRADLLDISNFGGGGEQ